MKKLACLLIALFLAVSASPTVAQGKAQPPWPGVKYAKVVGYFFEGYPDETFPLRNGEIDDAYLRKYARQQVILDDAQTKRLMAASLASKRTFAQASCYDPHHVFVFHNDAGQAVAAFEFCLSCKGFRSWPDDRIDEGLGMHHQRDFIELVKLCRDLSLPLGEVSPRTGQRPEAGKVIEATEQQARENRRP